MSSKIIFWLNDDLSGLGLPKILQEKHGFDIFGIFDVTDKPKKFLTKQKLINFQRSGFSMIIYIKQIKNLIVDI